MKKHPVLLGLAILTSLFFAFVVAVFMFARFSGESSSFTIGDKIGIVEVTGLITDSQDTIKELSDFRDNPHIKAVVVRIDSPGGIVGATQEVYAAVRKTGDKMPVVASCGSIAASGGYYIALGARKIVANPGTITGSIGVIMKFANAEELLHKIGLKTSVVKSGDFKDTGSPTREMTQQERAMFQGVIDDVHAQFVRTVADNRKIPEEKVRELADGRIFSGNQAMSLGLIDGFGNIEEAIALAGKMAGIEGEPKVIYPKQKGISLWDILFNGGTRSHVQWLLYSPYRMCFETGLR